MSFKRTQEDGNQVIYTFEGDLTADKGNLLANLEKDVQEGVKGVIFDLSGAKTPGQVPIVIAEANPENAVVVLPKNAEDFDWLPLWDAERATNVDAARAKVKLTLKGFSL